MKKLTCEMCGSTDLMKTDGVFVCQTCGTKYSVEEAKRMMVEGTVEVSNMANIGNLLKLANSAYDSKNYKEAERICNEIIGLDSNNYEAWFLKGQAINLQINANNPRVLEVYNCVMTAYRSLEEDKKEEKRHEILDFIVDCFMEEANFWLNNFEAGRPTAENLEKAKMAHYDSKNKLEEAIEELYGSCDESLIPNSFTEYYIVKANQVCVKSWKTTVGYNYYRDDFDTLGKDWSTRNIYNINSYRPNKSILETFIAETDNLIALLKYCENNFSDDTESETKINIYSNIKYYEERLIRANSYDWIVGGAYASSRWAQDCSLTAEAKESRRKTIREYQNKIDKEEERKELKEKEEKRKKIEEYWNEHKEEKDKLESEKNELEAQVKELRDEINSIPEKQKLSEIIDSINELTKEKKAIGVLKIKERKEIQSKIDKKLAEQKEIESIISDNENEINYNIRERENRVKQIENELVRER